MKRLLLVFGIFGSFILKAQQPPASWVINPNDWNYQMMITTILEVENSFSLDTNDVLAAFIDGQIRGVVQNNTVSNGQNHALLLVYNDQFMGGDTIDFQIYDSSQDSVFLTRNKVAFVHSNLVGTLVNPYKVFTNYAPDSLWLADASFMENHPISAPLTAIFSSDEDLMDTAYYSLVGGLGDDDNASFSLSNGSLFSNTPLDYEMQSQYSIRLEVNDSNGGVYQTPLILSVKDTNESPFAIDPLVAVVKENRPRGTLIDLLHTSDPDTLDGHSYSILSTLNSIDTLFAVSLDSLKSNYVFDFELQNEYKLPILTNDGDGGTYLDTVQISIEDVNEAPYFERDTVRIVEGFVISTGYSIPFRDFDSNTLAESLLLNHRDVFSLSLGGQLSLIRPLDFENDSLYELHVRVQDPLDTILFNVDTLIIQVINAREAELHGNTIITPNGDGLNDVFKIHDPSIYAEYTLTIYSSSGFMVYQKFHYDNSWDGRTSAGIELPEGAYYYSLKSELLEDDYSYSGSITLIR